jgi:SAM-dependent methyltransferase
MAPTASRRAPTAAEEIEAVLARHPAVRRAKVVGTAPGLIAYVEVAAGLSGGAAAAAHLERWRALWSDTYGRAPAAGAPQQPELAGWISSYTGRPIAAGEMREWVERTTERIAALAPRHLLEIGCGTGLLLTRLAPRCAAYWATDFSAAALDRVGRALAGMDLPVELLRRAADDFDGLPVGRFDTVVLNSVVQYFPDLSYLRRVLAGVLAVAAPGARVFLGDLRSLPLLATFHASVLLRQAEGATPLAEIRRQLERRVAREGELLVAPAFFAALQRAEPRIAAVEVQLKRGRARNELTRFRYDVVLTLGGAVSRGTGQGSGAGASAGVGDGDAGGGAPERWLSWRREGLTPAALRRLLAAASPGSLGVGGVPNARLSAEVEALALLGGSEPALETVADLQGELRLRAAAAAALGAAGAPIEPEALWALEGDLPYRVEIDWGRSALDTFDAVLRRQGTVSPAAGDAAGGEDDPVRLEERSPVQYANQPSRGPAAELLEAELRRLLAEHLPAVVPPASFVWVDCIDDAAGGDRPAAAG